MTTSPCWAWNGWPSTSAGVIDNSRASLQFRTDGRLAGNGTCNRLLGTYETEGERLTIAHRREPR